MSFSRGSYRLVPERLFIVTVVLGSLCMALYTGLVTKRNPQDVNDDKVRVYSKDLIDLNPEELFNRTMIITGFSQNHFAEAKLLINSVHQYLPQKQIIAYDLGLDQKAYQVVERWCNVKLRKFNFTSYPPHVANLQTYAFKPLIIDATLKEFGVIFWVDSSIRFLQDPRVLFPYLKEQHGLFRHVYSYDPELFLERTHPLMFKELGVDKDTYAKAMDYAPRCEGGRLLVVNDTLLRRKLIEPWVECALRQQCIAPPNSVLPLNFRGPDKYTHRFDQAALSLIAYKNMYGAWKKDMDRDELFTNTTVVDRRWPPPVRVKTCN